MITASALVLFCKQAVGTPYVYGSSGDVLTQTQINTWARLYPSTYTTTYINKARKFLGRRCTDCSGLISWATGIRRNSGNFKTTALAEIPISKITDEHIGWAVWKQGHIGVYIGGGKVIEAKGIDYGTIISNVKDTAWVSVLKLKDIDYKEKAPETVANGWKKENGIWRYYQNGKKVVLDWIQTTNNAGRKDWYYFDEDGNMLTGWLKYTDKHGETAGKTFWYYFDETSNEGESGRMVTSRVITTDGNRNYYMDENGHMVPPGKTITFTVASRTDTTSEGQLVLKAIN